MRSLVWFGIHLLYVVRCAHWGNGGTGERSSTVIVGPAYSRNAIRRPTNYTGRAAGGENEEYDEQVVFRLLRYSFREKGRGKKGAVPMVQPSMYGSLLVRKS